MPTERGILKPVMYQAIKQGYSFNAFYRSSQSRGVTYRRADMLHDWADVRAEIESANVIQSPGFFDFPKVIEVGNVQFTIPGLFYYKLRVDFLEPDIENNFYQYVTIRSEKPLTFGEILGQTSRLFGKQSPKGLEDIKGYKFIGAIHRPIP